tara:strand:+ start:20042 stop:20539 length:498 start_codon:yes stop_codon:yes gene_type:complete
LKINRKRISILNTFALLCLFVSCGSHKNIETTQASIEIPPKIIFLNYSIKKTADGHRSIRFLNKIVTDGKLKNTKANTVGDYGDLICAQLDKKSKVLERSVIKNPLSKNIEYLNGSNAFQRKQISLDSIQFSIRIQLKPNTKYISIHDFATFENQEKPLIKTQIY